MAIRPIGTIQGYVPTSVSDATKRMGNNTVYSGTVYRGGTTGQNLTSSPYSYPGSVGYSSGGGDAGIDRPKTTTSGGSSSSSKSSSTASNMANAYNALLAAYKQNDYSDYLNQMRAAAQGAYDRGMSALNSAYDNQMSSLSDNLNETRNQLANQYNRSKQSITDDAANSLRQAYINRMLSERNLGQQMTAQGLNGGATETTLANMLNNYGNARNNINAQQNRSLADLEGNYSNNLSQALQAYNSAVANANLQKAQQAMTLENALANNQISALGDYQTLMQRENQNYLDLLKTAIANGASFSYDPTSANNAFNAVAVQQAANPTNTNNLAALQALLNAQGAGTTSPGMTVVNTATQSNPYLDILRQLSQGA